MNSNQMPVSGGLAIFIAVIIGYFVIDPSALEGIRPAQNLRDIPQPHGVEDVQARLWQDPFAAAAEHRKRSHTAGQFELSGNMEIRQETTSGMTQVMLGMSKNAPNDQAEVQAEKTKQNSKQKNNPHSLESLNSEMERIAHPPKVLAVMVSAGPNPESGEIRLRRRYAVVAGLAASGYQPLQSEHIGYVDKFDDSGCSSQIVGDGDMPGIMPFEWFEETSGQSLLLLWLDEDAFSEKPLCKLEHLFSGFTEKRDQLSIIGPHSSGTLKAMLAELDAVKIGPLAWDDDAPFRKLSDAMFFSATATAEARKLLPAGMDQADSSKNTDEAVWDDPVSRAFIDKFIIFFRTIANDKQLTDKLVPEIKLRLTRFDAPDLNDLQVAFVTEWDTLYGRSLPDSFVRSACDHFSEQEVDKPQCDEWSKHNVFRFSYLRGIDGNISSEGSNVDGQQEKRKRVSALELPEGRSQKDYLRRLAAEIRLTHQKLRNDGKDGIQAIGVLGSDVYDKLLILRALRKQFPKAIFFTTDLDAALLHPEQFPWTRNLLVASSFDLQIGSHSDIRRLYSGSENKSDNLGAINGVVNEGIFLEMLLHATQRTIPQNRDVYQTSVFLSTVWASNKDLYRVLDAESEVIVDRYVKKEISASYETAAAKDDNPQKIFDEIKVHIREVFYSAFGRRLDPRVYEVGRFGARDLSGIQEWGGEVPENPFYPAHTAPVSSYKLAMIGGSLVLLLLAGFLFWMKSCRKGCEDVGKFRADWIGGGISVFVLALIGFTYIYLPRILGSVLLGSYLFTVFIYSYLAYKVRSNVNDCNAGEPE